MLGLLAAIKSQDLRSVRRFLKCCEKPLSPKYIVATRGNPQLLYLFNTHRRRLLWKTLLQLNV